jgi:hypothetical protein
MWLRYACTKYQQRARCGGNGNSDLEKTLIDEWRYVIALLRRNDGDAASRHVEEDDNAFVISHALELSQS